MYNKQLLEIEMQEMMNRMQQSDNITCHNVENLQFAHKRENDMAFMQAFAKPLPNNIRNVTSEYDLWTQSFQTRVATCDKDIIKRGGNNVVPSLNMCGGYECFKPCYTKEYRIIPCRENTYRNYLIADEEKACSISHQLFNNMTKRV
jgi:hypothetical protein